METIPPEPPKKQDKEMTFADVVREVHATKPDEAVLELPAEPAPLEIEQPKKISFTDPNVEAEEHAAAVRKAAGDILESQRRHEEIERNAGRLQTYKNNRAKLPQKEVEPATVPTEKSSLIFPSVESAPRTTEEQAAMEKTARDAREALAQTGEDKGEALKTAEEKIGSARAEVASLEQAEKAHEGFKDTTREAKVLAAEEQIRAAEKQRTTAQHQIRADELKAQIKDLEEQAARPGVKIPDIESKMQALEDQLHAEERAARGEESASLDTLREDEAKEGETIEPGSMVTIGEVIGKNPPETRREWKDKLRSLIMGMQEGHKRNKSPEEMTAFLAKDKDDWKERGKKLGVWSEKHITQNIEAYNKLHWSKKLAITGALVGGAALTSGVAPIVSGILLGGMYLQRVVGGIGFGMNRRKSLDAKIAADPTHKYANATEREKNMRSARQAMLYMGGTMLLGQGAVMGLEALGVGEWFGNLLGHHSAPVEHTPATVSAHPPEAHAMPTEGVAHGHGYEYSLKREAAEIWKQHIDPNTIADKNSDLYKLVTANEQTIDGVVHRIATDHHFYNADGTSIAIDPNAHITIGADHQVHIDDPTLHRLNPTQQDFVQAPEHTPTPTPPYHPEAAHAAPAGHEGAVTPTPQHEVVLGADHTGAAPAEAAAPASVPTHADAIPGHTAPASAETAPTTPTEVSAEHPEPPIAGHENILPNKWGLRVDEHVAD